MAARRLILAMIVLLVLSSAAAALVPVARDADDTTSSTTTPTGAQPTGKLVTRRLSAAGHKSQTVRIALGDELRLEVAAPIADQVEIPALGEVEDVDPFTPAMFDLLPDAPGRYVVRLIDKDRAVGHIVVTRPRAQADDRSTDSPGESTTGETAGALTAS